MIRKNKGQTVQKIFIDTGGWVALFVKNDKYHNKATSIFDDLKKIYYNSKKWPFKERYLKTFLYNKLN